jgi:hypothetical protein
VNLGIPEGEWVLIVKALGSIKGIHDLRLDCVSGSRNFHPFQAFADALNNAQSLRKLTFVLDPGTFPKDPSGLAELSNALREKTALEDFIWVDFCSRAELETGQSAALDLVLGSLSACPHIKAISISSKCASVDAIKNLLHLGTAPDLGLIHESLLCSELLLDPRLLKLYKR